MYFDVLRFEMYRYVKSVAIVVIYRYDTKDVVLRKYTVLHIRVYHNIPICFF